MISTRLTERFGIRHPIVCAPDGVGYRRGTRGRRVARRWVGSRWLGLCRNAGRGT